MSSQSGRGGIGSHKHGVSGKVHTSQHFTGKHASTGSKRKAKSHRKQRRAKRGTHHNTYKEYSHVYA
jgi:hypothetical protein